MAEKINRSHLSASIDPNDRLISLMGPEFKKYRQSWDQAEKGLRPDFPLHLDIDVTTACNLACPMCPAGNSGHIFPGFKKGLFLDFSLYERALKEGGEYGLPSVRLGVTGEPLLLGDIARWVRAARQSGVLDISLITNGQLLRPETSLELIEAGLTRLMISVDAASERVYRQVRPGGQWDLLLKNIDGFLEARAGLKSALPLLRLSFVEMGRNLSDRQSFEERFSGLADYLSFQRYLNILGGEETDFRPAGSLPAAVGGSKTFCAEPFTRMAVHADGGLFPCCSDFGRLKPIANLASASLFSAWNSKAAAFLTGAEAANHEPCRVCLSRSSA